MTISAQEQQVRLQFLEEAQDYVEQMESGLIGLGRGEVKGKQLDAVMRAAHSIKGGAAMMSFSTLSKIGHRLEDSLKVLRYSQNSDLVDAQLEKEMLLVVGRMRQVMDYNRRGQNIPADWLASEVEPLLDSLYQRLGDPQAMEDTSLMGDDEGEDDILVYLFESEVDTAIQHLEDILANPEHPSLSSELEITAETLNGLAEMVELPAMAALCQDISQKLQAYPDRYLEVAQLAVAAWRRSQSLVLVGHIDTLPTAIDALDGASIATEIAATPISTPAIEFPVVPDMAILDGSILEDAVLADTMPPVAAADELEIFNLASPANLLDDSLISSALELDDLAGDLSAPEPSIDELFSLDEILVQPAVDAAFGGSIGAMEAIDLADSGSLPSDAALAEIDFSILDQAEVADEALAVPDVVDTLPIVEDSNALDWLEQASPEPAELDADDFFGALNLLSSQLAEPESSDLLMADFDVLNEPDDISDFLELEPLAQKVPSAPEQTLRIGVNQLAEIGDFFGEINIGRNGLNLQITGIRALLEGLLEKVSNLESASAQLREAYDRISTQVSSESSFDFLATMPTIEHNSDFDLLEMDRYGEFHLLSQSVIESVVQIQEKVVDIELRLNETELVSRDIDRTTKQVQNRITSMRMLPFQEVVGRFPRALQEMALEHGKEVSLKVNGGDLLLERAVLDALKDPLMHILRNCFDHGLEAPQERVLAGKPVSGTIQVNAFYRGNQTVIEISDDGRGINLDKIRTRAVKMGIDEQTLADAGEKELLDLIFEPGFSTAEQVTDLSGRGVGMDVVKTNIQDLRGSVQIDTKAGLGSTFTITVPFNLSVIKVMIVESNKMLFAVPINGVEEMLVPDFSAAIEREGQKFLDWEEFQIRLVNMRDCFNSYSPISLPEISGIPKIDRAALLLVSKDEDLVGLQIDRFWQEQEVTVRQPQSTLLMPAGLSGCAILGDGRVLPLLDPLALVQSLDNKATLSFQAEDGTATIGYQEELILVVDDSINVRRFVALTLERNGYRVEQAKDGLEALEKVQAGLVPNAVICDLEMPRMDGYGFLANVKAIEAAKQVPVIMLTSRSGQKHRKLAMNLGAADYFAKPFNEADMLATLAKLIVKENLAAAVQRN
jgi:two-component system, chemotaxis family, sensor histidine kinase and response regulator PixL